MTMNVRGKDYKVESTKFSKLYQLTIYPSITIQDNSLNYLPKDIQNSICKEIHDVFSKLCSPGIIDIIDCIKNHKPIVK